MNYKLGETVEFYCFWSGSEKQWLRGQVTRIGGVDEHLFKARLASGYIIVIAPELDYKGEGRRSSLWCDEHEMRKVNPLDLIAEAASE